jgi:hypothetical protein
VKVEPVDGVADGVNQLSPKLVWSLVLIKHGPCHVQQRPLYLSSISVLYNLL